MMIAEKIACAVCGNEDLRHFSVGPDRRASCGRCHHSQRIDIRSFDYAGFAMGGTALSVPRLKGQVEFFQRYVPPDASVLEIGCAGGELAPVLRSGHSLRRYDGIELSPARARAERVLDRVYDRPLVELEDSGEVPAGRYDMILSSHCLEHLPDLHRQMSSIVYALSPRGILFIEVPNRSGNSGLPFDDNYSHLHFFSTASLTRLLAEFGLETLQAQTRVWYDARYSDSLRVVARRFELPTPEDRRILSRHPDLAGADRIVVWGAGMMAPEMLAHFLDLSRVAYFVDRNSRKHGERCLDREIKPVEALAQETGVVVIIGTLEFEQEIQAEIEAKYKNNTRSVISMKDLLTHIS